MRARLDLHSIEIPFRRPFRHAAAERATTESVCVEYRSRAGALGYGEACPRRYVTGEDVSTVRAFFLAHRGALAEGIDAVDDVIAWEAAHRREIDRNPAAWCAIELALLDALGRERGRSVEALLGLPELRGPFRYSAVIGVEDDASFAATVERYTAGGFLDFKLKLCGDGERDRARTAHLGGTPSGWRLRLDANNLWSDARDAVRYLAALDVPFFAIEEPLAPANRGAALAETAAAIGASVILDESCLRAEQLDELPAGAWIVNLRVSKMGGILRALRVVEAARRRGIPIVVGAQVGETSLLTRAALTVADQAADLRIAQEGAFGTLLLADDVADPPLMFGFGGVLECPEPKPGLGLDVRRDRPFLRPL